MPMKVENLPSITELMIRRLPSLYPLQATKIEDSKDGHELLNSIENNIKIISVRLPKAGLEKELQKKLDIQIAIIEHGYGGVGDNFNYEKIKYEAANK